MNKNCKEMREIVDNFELIGKTFLPKEIFNPDAFWDIRVIKRRKENPDLEKNSVLITSYQVQTRKELNDLKIHILKKCIDNNARAYINLNAKSYKKLAYQSLKAIADIIAEERYKDIKKVIDQTIGSGSNMKLQASWMKNWVVDVDSFDREFIDKVKELIESSMESEKRIVKYEIPTINGVHIITSPFNCKKFSDDFRIFMPDVEVPEIKKDQPTLLFYQNPMTAF